MEDTVIPFRKDFYPGKSIDVTKEGIILGPDLVNQEMKPINSTYNRTTAQFSIVSTLDDVCQVLQIPPAYALKVKAKLIDDDVVKTCLGAIDEELNASVIFRINFLQQTQLFPTSTKLNLDDVLSSFNAGNQPTAGFQASHWIQSLEIGNELIIIFTFGISDKETSHSIQKKLKKALGQNGFVDSRVLAKLEEFIAIMDIRLEKLYSDVKLNIEYCYYSEDQNFPDDMAGMLTVIKEFIQKCNGWSEMYKQNAPNIATGTSMVCSRNVQKKRRYEKVTNTWRDWWYGKKDMHYMRARIQALGPNGSPLATESYSESDRQQYSRLYVCLSSNMKAKRKLKDFQMSDFVFTKSRSQEANVLLSALNVTQKALTDIVGSFDFTMVPTERQIESVSDPEQAWKVDNYIQTATSRLSSGKDMDFIMFGKTGHGKSATGNSILGKPKFASSANAQSVTKSCEEGLREVDGCIIKVVDTPGVCDTGAATDKESIDMAVEAISEAVAFSPYGVHAFFLIIRFGERITEEERKAIEMMKTLFGQDIIKTFCVCIITHADNFVPGPSDGYTFMQWCKNQKGYIHDIFKECQYRCVPFDNATQDEALKKRQLIQLMATVERLETGGNRFKDKHFDTATKETDRLMTEEIAPEMNTKIFRDTSLAWEQFNDMNNDPDKHFTEDNYLYLKNKVHHLQKNINGISGNKLTDLSQGIQELATKLEPEYSCQNKFKKLLPESKVKDIKSKVDNLQKEDKDIKKRTKFKVHFDMEGEGCFSATSWVILKDGTHKTMKDLKVGDEILVRNANGQIDFDTVYMFGHCDTVAVMVFVVFKTKHQKLFVSPDHLVYCIKNGHEVCVPARQIEVNDELITFTSDGLVKEPVIDITSEQREGVYAPFTYSGTLIVDGTLASCYVDVLPHSKAHQLLWSIRKLHKISPPAVEFLNGLKRGKVIPPWAKLYLKWHKA